MEVLTTTLITSGSATVLASLFGIPLGAWLSSLESSKITKIGNLLIRTLYGLPPVVVGIWVYLMLSKEGALADLDWLFTIKGMIMAQTILIFPLVLGFSWFAFDNVKTRYGDTIMMTGATKIQGFWLRFSLAKNGVIQGIVLAFGRAIAEVGAVMMVGGNIAGQTRVMTTSILLETSKGELDVASTLGIELLIFSMLIMFLTIDLPFSIKRRGVKGSNRVPKTNSFDKLSLENVSVTIENNVILKNISMVVRGGEVVVILGESGSGKSTLLNAISGLVESSGKIKGVPELGPGGVLRVFQDPVALKDTVNSELFLSTSLHDIPACNDELLKIVGLDNYSARKIDSLSGGERQRILFARDLAMGPSLLLLDEFTSNLDGASIEIMEGIVKKHREMGGSAIIVTHNILQAKRLSDRMLFIHNGCLIDENSKAAKRLLSGQWSG
mgnify:CR=1 FL=1